MPKNFWQHLVDALVIPPVYAPAKPSDASLAEGWKVAYELERDLRISAEAALAELMPEVTEEDRDELARLLSGYSKEVWDKRSDRSPVKYYSRQSADRLIAAGYRKLK
jgi:hypothetical protein